MARAADETTTDQQTEEEAPTPNPGLKPLNKLVGKWRVSGETSGELTYEWLEGGFFLMAYGDTEQGGRKTRHIEIIGYDHELGAAPAEVMTSRLYTNRGDSLRYTHEVDDKSVTSWFGPKGSATVFKARWVDDDTLTGAWEWPGGGYTLTLTRIKGEKQPSRS